MAIFKKKTIENQPLGTEATNANVPADVVAAIAGAVAVVCGEQATVSSIRPHRSAGAGRSAWNMAGLLENTRPF